ncbi:DNA cross-link repair protein pso2/snm1 [Clohesyomyces aquaticus]|uniref:DNA cross-link repair protein pso2/snm1 n=1 Tax=Clohesyomyces aquaticus TaxID=1231657 RepID=A0A1Y1ZWA2_9PLEO|nr:DNA cross-link repair protein pso2/snm1 [Clohesyomyces aquaticus]
MFRNPRENRKLHHSSKIPPAVGRAPSPPTSSISDMAAKTASKPGVPKATSTPAKQRKTQTTLIPVEGSKKSPATNGFFKPKPKPSANGNGNIMAFFKKAEEINSRIFLAERGAKKTEECGLLDGEDLGWDDGSPDIVMLDSTSEDRYNENGGSVKRRRVSADTSLTTCTPPLEEHAVEEVETKQADIKSRSSKAMRRSGPFIDDSDSESETEELDPSIGGRRVNVSWKPSTDATPSEATEIEMAGVAKEEKQMPNVDTIPPLLKEETSHNIAQDFDEFEGIDNEDFPEGEEYDERRWMAEQQRLEMGEDGIEGDFDDFDVPPLFPHDELGREAVVPADNQTSPSCPICNESLAGYNDQEASIHVNACLDGNPIPVPPKTSGKEMTTATINSKVYKRPERPARPGQPTPFLPGAASADSKSAFSKLMASHAEDAAWATAAASETAARGKPSYQRTCPFYKILPGLYICVDAFRYGAVKGQNAYFLSHFHSDHYIGLTSTWSHGPIYCSKVTGNLVRQQLRVDPKWVVDLDFEKTTEIPNTEGVHVTMISANHCPGSSLFLFEKEMGKGRSSRLQRVLHCGDFRACQAHIKHPLLQPEVLDTALGKSRQQKLDACYLDTTYLNPKYAFPPQQQVIQACADMCVSLNKVRADDKDGWEQVKRDRAGEGMVKFVQKGSESKQNEEPAEEDLDAMKIAPAGSTKDRGRLLVVVGTYSIGKERICVGIAKALNSKIFAPPNKQKICKALEDPELNALLTKDPREAQVHMTPLFEIRAETLEDYLRDYRDRFSRAVGFRPSGWNYRPPNSRFTESPTVQTVLHSQNWKSQFSMRDLTPQRGSTTRASCFGVPYSEHSSFRELTMFCCALRIDKIIPTVNVGSAKSREKMKVWCEKWAVEKKKNGLFRLAEDGSAW